MAGIAIAMPRIVAGSLSGNSPIMQQPGVMELNAQSWLKSSLVAISGSGANVRLAACADNALLVYGLAPQAATTKGTAAGNPVADPAIQPPQSLFGITHYPQNLRGVLLEINICNAAQDGSNIGAGVGVTWDGTVGGVALAPGQQYGLNVQTSGTYNKYQLLDVSNTVQKLFEIVQLAPTFGGVRQAVNDNNPRVWVKLIDSVLQG